MADVGGLEPGADTYVASLVKLFDWEVYRPKLEYAWRLRMRLATSPLSLDDLCEPELRRVPWPSAIEPDPSRYPGALRSEDGLWSVPMFGRAQLRTLHAEMKSRSRVFLFGLSGVGKSHLLTMQSLASLADTTQRVCFIPNLDVCVVSRDGLWEALVEAFVCDPQALIALYQLRRDHSAIEDLFAELSIFVRGRNVLVIADQRNVVDKDRAGKRTHVSGEIANFIGSIGMDLRARLVFAASANQSSVSLLVTKQDRTHKVHYSAASFVD